MSGRLFAVIDLGSPRFDRWIAGFGVDVVPILSAEPELCSLEGLGDAIPCYKVDLDRLGASRIARLVALMVREFGDDPAAVLAEFATFGFPIIAEDIVVLDLDEPGGRPGIRTP